MFNSLSSYYRSLWLFLLRLFLTCFGSILSPVVLSLRLLLHHARVVTYQQHTEQCACNLAQPAEASEYQQRRGNESEHGHHRHLAAENVAEQVTEHVGSVAGGEIAEELAYASPG